MIEWPGRTVVCIASGPSLTVEDCELVRVSQHPTIVTNTTYQLCPWADVLFGFDVKWWKRYGEEARTAFPGRRISGSQLGTKYGAEWASGFTLYRNSGACAVSLALTAGAARIVLLGYDVQFYKNRRHWHPDHPGMDNCGMIGDWHRQFGLLAKHAWRKGVPIVNASRRTALRCFDQAPLETLL